MPITIRGIVYLDTAEAAQFANVDQETIRRWCRAEHITCIASGTGRLLIAKKSLEDFLLGGRPASP